MGSETRKTYIGTKIVAAEPMDEETFKREVKKEDTTSMLTTRDGYLVEYEDGYISWSPKDVFERSYRRVTDAERKLL